MSLQFIMGPSGSGKSHYLYRWVTEESLKNPNKNYIVLVPDQFTMQTQKDLVMANPRKGILNVDVLSFSRLAYRVFEEIGGNNRVVLNDVGKSFVLRKIAGDCESDLTLLGSNLKKVGFIGEVKSVISEFTQYDVQSETLEKVLSQMNPSSSFYYKLRDVNIIYKGFQEYLQDKYITGEELLDLLCMAVPKSKTLKDSVIVFDGFTGFTPVQNKLLRELLLVCEKIMVTVTMDICRKKIALFDMSEKMIDSLTKIAYECKTEVDNPVKLYEKPVYRFRENEALDFLESNLFRYSGKKYDKAQDNIRIYSAKNAKEEIDFVAQEIRRMARTKGMRYKDFAVIVSDMNTYANYIEKAFATYDIPVFMDYKRSILLNSFVEYLRSLLAMAEQNFTYESVFRYLRTELTVLTREEVDILENYCLALGVRGYSKWQEKWVRRAKGMEENDLEVINEIRQRFVDNIQKVMRVLKSRSKTVEDMTRALHEFLLNNQIQQKLKEYESRFSEAGELALEKEYAQVYRVVMELFDQFVELLGDERMSMKEYCELFDAGLEQAKIGVIPPSADQVVIGDIERTRIKDVKILFFVGVNDSHIPGKESAGGLITERDRERFAEQGITLAPGAKEKTFIQKFYIYMILTKPSEQVVITYNKTNSEDKSCRPAYLIFDLLKMYPDLQINQVDCTLKKSELTEESGLSYVVNGLQKKYEGLSEEWQELYSWYKRNPEWCKEMEKVIDATFYHNPQDMLTKETAESLYGTLLQNSVSRLESFSRCAYAHFLTYGLRMRERDQYQFQALDLGNLMHSAMEKYAKKLEKQGNTWMTVSEETRNVAIEESVEESIVDYENSILYSSKRNEYIIARLKRLMKRAVWALTKQLEKGDFIPKNYEIVYDSGTIQLEDKKSMRLYGKIDRVDVCETPDNVYVKIVDYKTGQKVFDLGELYHGLQMQLVVYMNAAMDLEKREHPEKDVIPAGLLYCQLHDPIVEKGKKLLNELKPSGVFNSSDEVIEHLEHNLTGDSEVLPIGRKKDGSLTARSKVMTEEDFFLVADYAEKKVREIGTSILKGAIDVEPYAMGEETGCKFCKYKSICGFDEKIPGYEYRHLEKLQIAEAIEKMREEEESWELNIQKNNNK